MVQPRAEKANPGSVLKALRLQLAALSLQALLRRAERVLPAVTEALPADRRYRARNGFAQLKAALQGGIEPQSPTGPKA